MATKNGTINYETGLNYKNPELLEPIYHFTNGINLASKDKIAEWHYNYRPNPYKLMVAKCEAEDIDDIYDYVQVLAMLNMPENVKNLSLNEIKRIENIFGRTLK